MKLLLALYLLFPLSNPPLAFATKGTKNCAENFQLLRSEGRSSEDQMFEQALSKGEILAIKKNPEETSTGTYFVTIRGPDSQKIVEGVFKSTVSGPSYYQAEEAAYLFDREFGFGIVPPTVVRAIALNGDGKLIYGSLQLRKEINIWKSADDFTKAKEDTSLTNEIHLARLFKFLVYDKDTNFNNIRLTKERKVVSIDHSMALSSMDPFGSFDPIHIRKFPENMQFESFKRIFTKINEMPEKTYADTMAAHILRVHDLDANDINAAEAQKLNWIMALLMKSRRDFLEEYNYRLGMGRRNNMLVEFEPYRYFKANSDRKPKPIGSK